MTFENLNALVTANLKTNKVPMLIGEPGIGKSSWVEALAAKIGTRCFTLAINQLADKADLTGARLVPVERTRMVQVTKDDGSIAMEPVAFTDYEQVFYPHQVICHAIEYAESHPNETPILFLDEINRTTPDVTSEALSIPTSRSIGARTLPNNLRVITAGNDKGNIQALDKASITRFVLYRVEPDLPTFMSVNPNLNAYIVSTLKKNPGFLYLSSTVTGISSNGSDDDDEDAILGEMELDETMEQITTPRTITALSDWLNQFDYSELIQMMNTPDGESNLLMSALSAHTGMTAFTLALMDEIISTQVVRQPQMSIQAPMQYPVLCNANSRDEINDILSRLSPEEKSAMLIYALYDGRDNTNIITCLAPQVMQIMPNDMTMLINLAQNRQLNRSNFDVLNGIQCTATQIIQIMNL